MNLIQSFIASIRQIATGFFVGVLVLGGLFAALFIYQQHWDELSRLPIIREFSNVYQEGVSTLKGVGGDLIAKFYEDDVLKINGISILKSKLGPQDTLHSMDTPLTNEGQLVVYTSWDRDRIVENLRQKGFSDKKLKNATRFAHYIDQHQGIAMRDMQQHKVLASIKLAQALLESNAGGSDLATASNNQFGIKALPGPSARQKIKRKEFQHLYDEEFVFKSPAIGVYNMHDDHHYDRFEKYETVGDSYARHTQLLTRPCSAGEKGCYSWIWPTFKVSEDLVDLTTMANVYYRSSGYKGNDFFNGKTKVPYYAAAAAGLKMAGYATSRQYHKKLAYLIETYELWRFDVDLLAAVNRATSSRIHSGRRAKQASE
ncbi:MAG: glucosaminidase domain-containing protein [Saprospiraceae bacterium]